MARGVTLAQVQAVWPAVLDEMRAQSKVAWMLVVDAQPMSVDGGLVVAAHKEPGTVKRFSQGDYRKRIAATLTSAVGSPLDVELVVGGVRPAHAGGQGRVAAAPEPSPSAIESEVADSVDADDLAGIELIEREFGATRISEFDGS